MHKLMGALELDGYEVEPTDFMFDVCLDSFEEEDRQEQCVKSLVGGLSLAKLLSVISGETELPTFETPDPTVVESTLKSYPATVQCRLDTYLKGTLQLERPACWFKD